MASNGREEASSHESDFRVFLSDLPNGSHEGSSSLLGLSREEHQQRAPRVNVCCGLNLPANSTLTDKCVVMNSTISETLGLVGARQLPLYHNSYIGYFVHVKVFGFGTPTAPPSAADPDNKLTDVGVSLNTGIEDDDDGDDYDGRRSEASSYASSVASTTESKDALKSRGKQPPVRDTIVLQAMRSDGKKLTVKQLRSVLPDMGKVILNWDLRSPTVSWDDVKSFATAYGVDPDQCFDPNNPEKSKSGTMKPKPKQKELQKVFTAMKTIIDAICADNPNYMDKYYKAAALAERISAASVQVQDNVTAPVPVPVKQHSQGTSRSAIAATPLASVKNKNHQRLEASATRHVSSPICKKRERPVTNLLQRMQRHGASLSVILNESLESNNNDRQVFPDMRYATASEDAVNSNVAPVTTSQFGYIQLGSLATDGVSTRSENSLGSLNDVPNTSTYMPAASTADAQMLEKLAAMSALQGGEQSSGNLLRENYADCQYSTTTLSVEEKMAPELERQSSKELDAHRGPCEEAKNDDDFVDSLLNSVDEIKEIMRRICGDTKAISHSVEAMEIPDPNLAPSTMLPQAPAALLGNQPPVVQATKQTPTEVSGSSGTSAPWELDDIFMDVG